MTLNEHQQQALSDLIEAKKIDILESLGHDAIKGSGIIYEMNLKELEDKISQAIFNCDELILGEIMMNLFMNYNICTINEKAQELKDEAMQQQDDEHSVCASELDRQHHEYGVNARDFFHE